MIVTETTPYLEHFQRLSDDANGVPERLRSLRSEAIARFQQLGFPSTKLEGWRFTNIAPLAKQSFTPLVAPAASVSEAVRETVSEAVLDESFHRLVFVNGFLSNELSSPGELPPGLAISSLAESLRDDASSDLRRLACQATFDDAAMTALNTALFRDGASIRVDEGVKVDTPIQLIYVSDPAQSRVALFPRNLVLLGKSASARLVETHIGLPGGEYFTDAVTEIGLDESAELDHYKLQNDSIAAYHIASTHVRQTVSSRYRNHYFAFGGAVSRNEIHCMLAGEAVHTVLNGLYLLSGNQLGDCRTCIDHAMPNCESHEMYKGILDNRSRGVFNGRIHVHPDAQKTDAKQSNRAILLSDDAVIDTKPELEIYADDVRCTHGATVGELDAAALFYLRSRGIPEALARKMLIFAFANDVVQGTHVEPLKKYLESVLLADHGLPQV